MAEAKGTACRIPERKVSGCVLVALMQVLARVPGPLLWLCATPLGLIAHVLDVRGRRSARINLALCFPEMPVAARRRLTHAHYRLAVFTLLNMGFVWGADRARVRARVHVHGEQHLGQVLDAGGRAILLAPHFLAMDIGGIRLSLDYAMVSMFKAPKRFGAGEVMRQGRTRFGLTLVERDAPLRPLLRQIQAGRVFYYLPDQDPGLAPYVFAPFFGVATATVSAASRIAAMTGARLLPCVTTLRAGGWGYDVRIYPPIEAYPSGDAGRDAAAMNQAIEARVREFPAHYLWTYKRFKTRPAGEPDPYRKPRT